MLQSTVPLYEPEVDMSKYSDKLAVSWKHIAFLHYENFTETTGRIFKIISYI